MLLENGALIDRVDPDTDYRFAHYVAMSGNLDIINRAIDMNVDFLVKSRDNLSPLHFACQNGHLEAAMKLIELGADINALSTEGYTTLHASCAGGNHDLFKMLLDMGLDIHSTYRNGVSSIHAAAFGRNFDILNYLIDQKVDSSKALFNPLHVAAELNNLEMTKKLLDLNFDINSVDSDGETPLHYACIFEFNELANYLLDHGAKIDILNAKGESAVHQAHEIRNYGIIYHERLRMIWTLYSNDQEIIDKSDSLGDKRAGILSAFPQEYSELLKPLLNHNADLNTTILDEEGNNVLLLACKHGLARAVNTALDSGLSANVFNSNGDSPLHLTCASGDFEAALDICCLPNSAFLETTLNKKGQNSLHCAFLGDNPPKFIFALAKGNVPVADNDGNTPVHLAFAKGYYKCFIDLDEVAIDFNVKNNEGKTPLHLAADNGHLDAVKFLIEKGVDSTIVDINNHLAIDLAKMNEHNEIVEFLSSNH